MATPVAVVGNTALKGSGFVEPSERPAHVKARKNLFLQSPKIKEVAVICCLNAIGMPTQFCSADVSSSLSALMFLSSETNENLTWQ